MESRYHGSLGRDVTSLIPTVTISDSLVLEAYRVSRLCLSDNRVDGGLDHDCGSEPKRNRVRRHRFRGAMDTSQRHICTGLAKGSLRT